MQVETYLLWRNTGESEWGPALRALRLQSWGEAFLTRSHVQLLIEARYSLGIEVSPILFEDNDMKEMWDETNRAVSMSVLLQLTSCCY